MVLRFSKATASTYNYDNVITDQRFMFNEQFYSII